MSPEEFKRRLTAILSADVEGYSRLMREDDEATIRTLKTYQAAIRDLVRQYRGRVVDSPGDNLLAEFASVLDGVNCGVEIQRELSERNTELPENRRMRFRIGVNLGDIVEDGERIYGDGVNIAARMEGLAEGGGICISGKVYDEVKHKLGLEYEYQGEQKVKNIPEPVRAYKVLSFPGAAAHRVIKAKKAVGKTWRNATIAIAAVLVLGAGVWAIWNSYFRPPAIEPASVEKMAYPLPDKPSIAVLPFDNMSGDPEQEYFSDGLTEELITDLSKTPKMFVIARNSTFTYKGKPVKIKQVAEELGVRYVLEGSVRKAEDRVRITAQLIDALSGHHLWAERYDRDLKDIFALQDEITMKIINALQVELTEGEHARLWGKGTDNLEAYLKSLRAREYYLTQTKEDNDLARRFAEEAIALDPEYAPPYHVLSITHFMDILFRTTKSPKQSMSRAVELIQKAIALDDSYALAHGWLGFLYAYLRKYKESIMEAQKGVALDPNGAHGYLYLCMVYRYAGRFEEAVEAIEKALRLDPFPPNTYFRDACRAYSFVGRYEEAIAAGKKAVTLSPNDYQAHLALTIAYSLAGRQKEARIVAEELLRLHPKFSLVSFGKMVPYKNKADKELVIGALRKAGLPENPPLPLPDKPSIAVLPFTNMSGDPKQEYFSDGMTEEILTALSKTSKLFVIARTSSFKYKGKEVDVRTVGRELGVRYVLEGSVRRSEDRVRITAQLVDAKTGNHVWAQRYDRDLKDIFALQDEITMRIITELQVQLTEGEQSRMWGKQYKNLDVYLKHIEARSLWAEGTIESHVRFGRVAQETIDMAPESATGYRLLAWHNWHLAMIGKSPRESIGKAFKLAQKALSMDESDSLTHLLLGSVYLMMRKYEKAIAAGERSVELDPNGAMAHALLGMTLSYADRPDEAIGELNRAIRLNPFSPYWYFMRLGQSYRQKGQYKEALSAYKKALQRAPDAYGNHVHLAIIYVLLDRQEEARAAAKKVLELYPNFSVERISKTLPYKNQADLKLVVDSMHKAGLK